ncbi:MAG: hypothetical protein QG559_516 [Campylobacterota bacterium]|nr:hypothetical protein [Campylobacterota bacterium]
MKSNLSRQNIYLIAISTFLLIFVLIFSFAILIPEGQSYRNKRTEVKKELLELEQVSELHKKTSQTLEKLHKENANTIRAFGNSFAIDRFQKTNQKFFSSLEVSKIAQVTNEDGFSVYEVNTTSAISSPQNFYDFLDSINKSDWVIAVNFPIEFKRENNNIKSSFTMKVYNNSKESNSTKSE